MKSTAAANHSSICVTSSPVNQVILEVADPAMVHQTLRFYSTARLRLMPSPEISRPAVLTIKGCT